MQFIDQLTNNFLVKKIFLISFLGAFLGVSISYFIMYSELQDKFQYSFLEGLLAATLGVFLSIVISKLVFLLNKFFPWKTNVGVRLFIGLIVNFSIIYFLTLGFFYLYNLVFFDVTTFFEKYHFCSIKLGILLLILTLIFEVVYFALYSYYSYSKFQIETVKQQRKQIELQLKALKSQLSPHFLFNSLNTISSLVFKHVGKAEIFIRRLAKMYDFTLKVYHLQLITVEEEINFVKSYIYLMQTRFEGKFVCEIAIDDDLLSTKIPPLTLQMLVENAVKHNQLSLEKPLKIKISSTASEIVIENNITEVSKNVKSFNIGLKNINKRYQLLVNKTISIIRNTNFIVEIPIIR